MHCSFFSIDSISRLAVRHYPGLNVHEIVLSVKRQSSQISFNTMSQAACVHKNFDDESTMMSHLCNFKLHAQQLAVVK